MYSTGKRGLTEGNISTGQSMVTGGGTVHYDTNLTVGISTDSGVTAQGTHGRFAIFSDTRTRPLVPDTSKFTLSLVRGNVTTDNFPLFVPLLRPSSAAFPNPVIENGASYWETTMQPGLAMTWTGPVYSQSGVNGITNSADNDVASWPTYGYLPVYCSPSLNSNPNQTNVPKVIDLGAISSNPDCMLINVVARLTTAINALLGNTFVTVASSAGYLTFTSVLTSTMYLDFTMPSSYEQSSLSPLNTTQASKQGILQTCKLLGFIPGQVLALPPNVTITAPRPFQLAFRTTLNLFSYKNVRWTPEDTSVVTPTASEVASGYLGTYFDCYTYQHLLNQCVNPTFQRLIFDEWDGSNTPYIDQCLQRQLYNACYANCNALLQWSEQTSYGAGPTFPVVYKGRAYYPQTANINVCPILSLGVVNPTWVDCGPSILNSFVLGVVYNVGDVVTYNTGASNISYYSCATTTNGTQVPGIANWSARIAVNAGSLTALQYNYPAIGTLSPTITYNPSTSLFVLNLDSYGFGGTQSTNVYEGYAGVLDDTRFTSTLLQQSLNSTLNDQARDSWGLTGTISSSPTYTTFRHPGVIYDERFVIEADDYFNQLFGNWPTLRLTYIDPRTSVVTSYVRYGPQAANAGLAVPLPLPLVNPTVANTGYLPFTRVAGNQPFIYTFPQDYASVGLMWNPIDTIVITSGDIPVLDDQILPPCVLGDNGVAIGSIETPVYNPNNPTGQSSFLIGNGGGGQSTNAATLKIIGEFIVNTGAMQTGQEYRNQIVFEPQTIIPMDLQHGVTFNKFSYQAWMRMKSTQLLRPVTLSNGGSLNMRWRFDRKY
jgi:hypothetical protein